MKLLNRFLFLSCTFSALSMFSQVKQTGFKIDENGDPIPAILLNFDAIFDNTKVELTWSTLERSPVLKSSITTTS